MDNLIGESPAMREVLDTVRQVAPSTATILLLGETGTGKELIAKVIHQLSTRARQPLVTVHCAGLAPTLLESELFGHEKGAFTDAHERRIGRFEQAQGGTLFLDEIGEIDPTVQIKLLRFLGERTFERVGSSKTLTADVRVISATNKNLQELVKAGAFREDLYYRLRVIEIKLPPLRERAEDIPLLAQSFLNEFSRADQRHITGFTGDAMDLLLRYSWPGNVRELRAAMERAVVLCRGEKIGARDLPPEIRNVPTDTPLPKVGQNNSLSIEEAEKQLIIRALKDSNGSRTLAAKKLGMHRRTLHRKLNSYKLEGV
jgi:DNA-binding NtrC family response regulator